MIVQGYNRQGGYSRQPDVVGNSYVDNRGTRLTVSFEDLNSLKSEVGSGVYEISYLASGVSTSTSIGSAVDDMMQILSVSGNNTYYISTTGNDYNDGKSASYPFKTFARLQNTPEFKTLQYTGSCVINIASGTYTEQFVIYGLNGDRGNYNFICPTSSVTVTSMDVRDCDANILFTSPVINSTGTAVYASGCTRLRFLSPQLTGSSVTGTKYGFYVYFSTIKVFGATLNSCTRCVLAEDMSNIFMQTSAGTGNTYTWYAEAGADVRYQGTVPTSTTSSFAASGSRII